MNYRKLGRAGVRVSEVALGSWLTYGHGVGDDAAKACIRRAFELGINFFDTADVYNHGAAEEVYGRELAQFRRADLVIATKVYFPMSDGVNDRGLSRKHIFESIDGSLKRLRTDYLDLYQCHRFDENVEMSEIVRAMDDLIRRGKVLYWGVSEWPASAIREACHCARTLSAFAPVSEQPEYSLAARRVETNGVQATCRELGLGLVVWSPLKQGVLTGKYTGGQIPPASRAASEKMNVFMQNLHQKLAERVDQLRPIADRHHLTLAQLAIAWLLKRAALASVLVGASRVEQVEENAAAAGFELTPDDLKQIDTLFPAKENP